MLQSVAPRSSTVFFKKCSMSFTSRITPDHIQLASANKLSIVLKGASLCETVFRSRLGRDRGRYRRVNDCPSLRPHYAIAVSGPITGCIAIHEDPTAY
ncbi:hypothetical protein CEXT_232821 [Caerostris extrusa]|uniref:Uncharacterized protein n=1 Tax=Caerostris extrusa TaxID=172846 RepID=A0AAV4XAW4_CAEEX|nr:hypothetical protein CEXT_232821 [Caerostris extrusa]